MAADVFLPHSIRIEFAINHHQCPGSQSYQILISLFFRFLLLSLAISKYIQYFLMLQTLKLSNKKRKKSSFYKEKSLVGLTPMYQKDSLRNCIVSPLPFFLRTTQVQNHSLEKNRFEV